MRMGELINLESLKNLEGNKINKEENNVRKISNDYKERKNIYSNDEVRRGDVFYADLTNAKGLGKNVQAGKRPIIIMSNDKGNEHSPNINIVPVSSQIRKLLPPHLKIKLQCLDCDSIVLGENIGTIGKEKLQYKIGHCPNKIMLQINNKINMQMNTIPKFNENRVGKIVKHIRRLEKQLKIMDVEEFREMLESFQEDLNDISILHQIPVEQMMNMFDEKGERINNQIAK